MSKSQIVAGLEMGCTRLRMAAGEVRDGGLGSLTVSETACPDGVNNGMIINFDNVSESIIKLLDDVARKKDAKVNSVFINISGLNLMQEVVNSVITLPQRGCEIAQKHIDSLIESCKIISVPIDRHLLYLLPLEYIIDGQDGIRAPIGLCGSRLEARVLIITAPFNQVQNITKVVNSAGLEVEDIILNALANASAILNTEEAKEGVLLIDFKTGLTDVSIFKDDALIFFETIPKGQRDVTEKIAARFNIPYESAEGLKMKYGFLDIGAQDGRSLEIIPVEWMGAKQDILRGDLNKIISEQVNLIFDLIWEGLKKTDNFNNMVKRGAVLTGGSIYMEGFLEGAHKKLRFATRLGNAHATSAGLAKYGYEKKIKNKVKPQTGLFRKMYRKADELLTEYF